jgi:hypothetical protein
MTLAATWHGAGSLGHRMPWLSKRPSTMLVEVSKQQHGGNVWVRKTTASWANIVSDKLEELSKLKRGWDGENAAAPTTHALLIALLVLAQTMAADTIAPAIFPTPSGGLQLEWHQSGVDIEIYIGSDGDVAAWGAEGPREWEEDFFSRSRLSKELSRLTTTLRG